MKYSNKISKATTCKHQKEKQLTFCHIMQKDHLEIWQLEEKHKKKVEALHESTI